MNLTGTEVVVAKDVSFGEVTHRRMAGRRRLRR